MAKTVGIFSLWLNEETIMSWAIARFVDGNRDDIEKARQKAAENLKDDVRRDLEKLGFYGIKFRWSRTAGCSCGCSPGFLIIAEGHKDKDVWERIMDYRESKKLIYYGYSSGRLKREFSDCKKRERYIHREYVSKIGWTSCRKTRYVIDGAPSNVLYWLNRYLDHKICRSVPEIVPQMRETIATTKEYGIPCKC